MPTGHYTRKVSSLRERLLRKIRVTESGCWLWTGRLNACGYGTAWDGNKTELAHRAAYKEFIGPIPEGMTLDHRCHDPSACQEKSQCQHRRCINPEHLKPASHLENIQRGGGSAEQRQKRQREATHCKKGHEFTPENTYIATHKEARDYRQKICKICEREKQKRNRRLKRIRELAGH